MYILKKRTLKFTGSFDSFFFPAVHKLSVINLIVIAINQTEVNVTEVCLSSYDIHIFSCGNTFLPCCLFKQNRNFLFLRWLPKVATQASDYLR